MSVPNPATTDWVPLGGSTVDLRYLGAWATGSYVDGDVAVGSDGIAYLCVRPTTANPVPSPWPISGPIGQPGPQGPQGPTGLTGPAGAGVPTVQNGKYLAGSGGAAVWSGLDSYATTLPAGVDGQRVTLVDSVTNPSYQWEFRFNAQSTSAYKWEFVGGSPAYIAVEAQEATTSTSPVDLTTPGPSFTLPRSGDYMIEAYVRATKNSPSGWCTTYTIVQVNNVQVAPYIELFATVYSPSAGIVPYDNKSEVAKWTRTAGDVLKMTYQIIAQDSAGQSVLFSHRRLTVTPVRVS